MEEPLIPYDDKPLLWQGRRDDDYDAWLKALRAEHGADRVIEVLRGMVRILEPT